MWSLGVEGAAAHQTHFGRSCQQSSARPDFKDWEAGDVGRRAREALPRVRPRHAKKGQEGLSPIRESQRHRREPCCKSRSTAPSSSSAWDRRGSTLTCWANWASRLKTTTDSRKGSQVPRALPRVGTWPSSDHGGKPHGGGRAPGCYVICTTSFACTEQKTISRET